MRPRAEPSGFPVMMLNRTPRFPSPPPPPRRTTSWLSISVRYVPSALVHPPIGACACGTRRLGCVNCRCVDDSASVLVLAPGGPSE